VECADISYFSNLLKKSPVEFYAAINDPEAVKFVFSFLNVTPPQKDIHTILFLYNPERRDSVGVVPLVEGCATEKTYIGFKIQIDQSLSVLLHRGHDVFDHPIELIK
jgi:hypothetical protein